MDNHIRYFRHNCGSICFEHFKYCPFCGERISLYETGFVEFSREHYHPELNPCFFSYDDDFSYVNKVAIKLNKIYGIDATTRLNAISVLPDSEDSPEIFLVDKNNLVFPDEFKDSKIFEFTIHPNNVPFVRRNTEVANTIQFVGHDDEVIDSVQIKVFPYPVLKAKEAIRYIDLSKVSDEQNVIDIFFELYFQKTILELLEENINLLPIKNSDGKHIELLKHIHYKKVYTGNPAQLHLKIPLGPLQDYISNDITGRKAILSFEPIIHSIFKSRVYCETLTTIFEQKAIIIIREWILPENARIEICVSEEQDFRLTFKNDGRVGGFFRFKRFETLSTNIGISIDETLKDKEIFLSKSSDDKKNSYILQARVKDLGSIEGVVTCRLVYEYWSLGQNESDASVEYKTFTVIVHKEKTTRLLAIDFGTTSSCVGTSVVTNGGDELVGIVLLNPKSEKTDKVDKFFFPSKSEVFELQREIPMDFSRYEIPTVIQYIVKEDYTIEKKIGYEILSDQRVNTFELFKMNLGSKQTYDIFTPDNIILKRLNAEDLARDFIHELYKKVIKITGKPETIIATHPVKYTYSQINKLTNIFSALGYEMNKNLKLIDEASASLYDVIFHRCELFEREMNNNEQRDEKILIYDLGGGTLDITYNKIIYSKREDGLKLRVRIENLESDGDSDFSGCNITKILQDIIVNKIENKKQKQGMKIIRKVNREFLKPINRGEIELYHASNINEDQLYKYSEKSKIKILMQKSDFETLEVPYSLTAIYGREVREIYFGKTNSIYISDSYIDLKQIISEIYKDDDPENSFYGKFFNIELKRSLLRVGAICKKYGEPDLIILNGQAAQTNLIKSYLNQIYNNIVRFNDPKNILNKQDKPSKYMKFSVVIGAILSEMEGVYDIKSGQSSRRREKYTRTRIGYMVRTTKGLRFNEMVGKKKKLFDTVQEGKASVFEFFQNIKNIPELEGYAYYTDTISVYYDNLISYKLELVEKIEASDDIDDLKNSIKMKGTISASLSDIDEDLVDEDDYVQMKRYFWLDKSENVWMLLELGGKFFKTKFETTF